MRNSCVLSVYNLCKRYSQWTLIFASSSVDDLFTRCAVKQFPQPTWMDTEDTSCCSTFSVLRWDGIVDAYLIGAHVTTNISESITLLSLKEGRPFHQRECAFSTTMQLSTFHAECVITISWTHGTAVRARPSALYVPLI
jgi:hypothetical protein